MVKAVTKRDVFWGYLAAALNIGAGLILLPVVVKFLSADDVGLWFVFIALANLVQLLEMGFQPTLARNTAYIYSGAQGLNKVGLPNEVRSEGEINKDLLDVLVASARRIYQIVAIIAAPLLLVAGTYYISTLLTPNQNKIESLVAWVAFSGGYIVSFYYGFVNGLLQGRGDISQANKVIVITKGLLIILGGSALALGFGMLGLGLASMMAAIVGRFAAHRFFYANYDFSTNAPEHEFFESRRALIAVIWHNAGKLGIVQLGAFLIQRGSVLVASSFLGLTVAANYGITVTVLMTLAGIAAVYCQLQVPHISALQAKGDRSVLAALYGQILILSWSFFIVGLTIFIFFGPLLLELASGSTAILPPKLLIPLGLIFLLEMNHSIAGIYLSTTNKIPFLNASIFSGSAIFISSILAVPHMGLAGLVMAQGLVQMAYNNWKWPLAAIEHIGLSKRLILMLGLKRIVNTSKTSNRVQNTNV